MAWDGTTVAITGASSGLGAEMARQLAAAGARVGLTARRADLLDELAGSIRGQGGTVAVAPADAADRDATRAALHALAAELGPIDVLIANAGVSREFHADAFDLDALEGMIRVNLLGAAYAIDAVLPTMRARGRGHIVGISSLAAYRGLPHSSGYCATKAGLTALLEGLRVELKPRGIAVTSVHPGFVRTPMTAHQTNAQPFILDAEPAVRIMLRGIASRRPYVSFPRPLALLASLGRWLPAGLSDRMAVAVLRK